MKWSTSTDQRKIIVPTYNPIVFAALLNLSRRQKINIFDLGKEEITREFMKEYIKENKS